MQNVSLGSRLKDAIRIAFFARVPDERLQASWLEIVAAAFLALCIPTAYDLIERGAQGIWSVQGLPGALFFVPVFLLGAAIVARIARRDDTAPTILFGSLLAWIVIDIVSLVAWAIVMEGEPQQPRGLEYLFFYLPLGWLALVVARLSIGVAAVEGMRQLVVLAAAAAFFALPLAYLQPERSLWVEDWARSGAGAERPAAAWGAGDENAFYRQPDLLAAELAAVKKGKPGVTEVFFIGMAGHGYQDVFMREVDAVADLMRERFGADGHVIKLVNNPKTLLTSPIASLTSLQGALRRTAAQMDAGEDILVLFLTSHGSADHKFSLDLFPMRFKQLDPATLRRALDDSGIRHRVVVISACYSGGFAEKLKDPDTLVITAAAPDRNSFGCSNEAEWTYFGKAYFDQALRETRSFTRAFEMATVAIEQREAAEKQTPSKPVMIVGEAIGARLAELERELN